MCLASYGARGISIINLTHFSVPLADDRDCSAADERGLRGESMAELLGDKCAKVDLIARRLELAREGQLPT